MDLKSQYEAYENSKRVFHISDNQTAERMNIPVGSEYTSFPPPTTKEEAFERLKMYTGLIQLEYFIKNFKLRFPINLRTLKDELKTLTDFIDEAEEISTVDAFTNKNVFAVKRNHYEYLKWKYGYYENLAYNGYEFFSTDAVYVYGKYFLYKKWIEEQITELTPNKQIDFLQKHKENLKYLEKINPKKDITIFERIKRELNTIHWVVISQSLKKEQDVNNLINEDGRICRVINLRSDRELIGLEEYKQHYTERFENANTNVVVKNELIEIYRTALVIKNLYEANLSYSNPLVKELFDSYRDNPKLLHETSSFRTMIVLVVDYRVQNILFGYDSNSNDYSTVFTIRDFNYHVRNDELIGYCYSLINLINTFEIPELSYMEPEEIVTLRDDFEFNLVQNDSIFKTVEGFMIFKKFYTVYKTESKGQQSNFSFLFYALKKNNLLNCSNSNYIAFCKKNSININTVVARMSYDSLDKKHPLIVDYEKFASEVNAQK